jgi:hypothetical protein
MALDARFWPAPFQAGEGHDDTPRIGTMKSAPQCGSGKSRSPTVRPYTLLCIYKSSNQTGNLPGGMWQTGHTAGQCGSRRSAGGTDQATTG